MGGMFEGAKEALTSDTGRQVLGGIGTGLQTYSNATQGQNGGGGSQLPQVMSPAPVQIPQADPSIYGANIPGMPEYRRKFNAYGPRPSNGV